MKRYLIIISVAFIVSTFTVYAVPAKRRDVNKLETLKIWKLIDYLQLTDKQADRFLPRFRNFEKDIHQMQISKDKKTKDLLNKIRMGKTKGLNDDVNAILDIDIKMSRRKKEFFNGVRGIISEEQMAKMIVFEYQFRREVRRMIEDRTKIRNSLRRR